MYTNILPSRKRTCEVVEIPESKKKKQKVDLELSIQVSKERLDHVKDILDSNPYSVLLAAPQSGKSTMTHALCEYLEHQGEHAVKIYMGDWKNGDEQAFIDYFSEECDTSWNDILQSKKTYLLLYEAQTMFRSTGGFWPILDRFLKERRQNLRIMMCTTYVDAKILSQDVVICRDQVLRLSREECRNMLQKSMKTGFTFTVKQLNILYALTAGHPKILEVLVSESWRPYGTEIYRNHKSFVEFMVSPNLQWLIIDSMPQMDMEQYGEKECGFLRKMLLEMDSEGVFRPGTTSKETIDYLKNCGAICETQGDVQFSVPILKMAFTHFVFPGDPDPIAVGTNNYTFDGLLDTTIRHLQPEQLRRFLEEDTEAARRELLVALFAIIAAAGNILHYPTLFVGSTFGSAGYTLDIHIDGPVKWAIDIMPRNVRQILREWPSRAGEAK